MICFFFIIVLLYLLYKEFSYCDNFSVYLKKDNNIKKKIKYI
jgi:hypothetical protein